MKKALPITLTAVLLAALLAFPAAAVSRPTAAETPVGTLIIGTHMIYAPSMTSPLYELALQSAADPSLNSQQNSVCYKSEFAGGQWIDISAATNIYDLSAVSGKFVDNSVVDALTLKFYTPADGKTYDLSSGKQVAVSDIISPYDAREQTEMEPLISNLSALNEKRNSDGYDRDGDENPDVINTEASVVILNDILNASYRNEYTNYLDSAIAALNSALDHARGSTAAAQKQEALAKLAAKYDHRRRAASLTAMRDKLLDGLGQAAKKDLQGLISTMSPVVETLETQIQAHLAAGGSGTDDTDSGGAGKGNTSPGGENTASESGREKIRSDLESRLLDLLVAGGSDPEADKLLNELINMDNLDKGAVVSPAEELATALDMMNVLRGEFLEKLYSGAIDELAAASPDNPYAFIAAEQKQADIFESARLELQSAVEAAGKRMNAQEYEAMLSTLLAEASGMPLSVRNGASKPKALESVQKYTDWLGSEYRAAGEESAVKSKAQLLQIEINGLEQKSKEALDKNDLVLADSLDREIADKAAQLSALEDDTAAKLSAAKESLEKLEKEAETARAVGDTQLAESLTTQISSLRSEINALEASLPVDTRMAQEEIMQIKQAALDAVAKGDAETLTASLESIAAFVEREPVAALVAAEAIQNAILRKEAMLGAGIGNLSEARELVSSLLPGLREKASAVSGAAADIQKLRELCDSMLEPPPEDIPARIAAALQVDGGKADENLLAFVGEYYQLLPYGQSFTPAVVAGTRYVPAAALPCFLNLRFLPPKNNECLLTNGALYYRFTRGSSTVKTNAGSLDMEYPAYYGGNIAYLPESFVTEQFGLSVLDIPHRGTAILIDKACGAKAAEISAAMEGG